MVNEIVTTPQNYNALIQMAIESKDVDAEKLALLLKIQKEVMATQAEIEFNEAMARLQPKLPMIERTTKAEHHKYAKHEDIEAQIRHLYTAEGFSTQYNGSTFEADGSQTFHAILKHKGGHFTPHQITLPMDEVNKSKNKLQATASSFTYAQRILLKMMFNLVIKNEDTDGMFLLAGPVDDAQFEEIQRLIEESQTDTAAFCNYLKVDSLKAITQKQYPKAINELKAKLEKLKGKKNA